MAWQNMLPGPVTVGQDVPQIANMLANRDQQNRQNQLADIAFQRNESRYQQEQGDREQEQKLRSTLALIEQADGAPPEVQAQVLATISQQDPDFGRVFGQMPPGQALQRAGAGIRTKLGVPQPQAEAPYQISEQPGPYGSRIVTDNKRFQVVDAPRPAVERQQQGPQAPSGYRFKQDGTGTLEFIPGGPFDPNVRAGNAGAVTTGKGQAQALLDLPTALGNAENNLKTLTDLKRHPGLSGIFGIKGMVPNIRGGAAAGAEAFRQQVLGAAFLEAFQTLKGGGQITEVEGNKATAAITRLQNNAISVREAITAINDLEAVINAGIKRAKTKAQAGESRVVDFNSL